MCLNDDCTITNKSKMDLYTLVLIAKCDHLDKKQCNVVTILQLLVINNITVSNI